MTDLVKTSDLGVAMQRAKLLAASTLLPGDYRDKPANLLLMIETADSLGINLMQALQGIDLIKGKPTMSAELMRALVIRDGHRFKIDKNTAEGCRVLVARREWPDDVQEFVFTIADAKRAGLNGDNWHKYPAAMCLARATSMACRAVFPDVIAGISYTAEELEPVQFAPLERAEPQPEPQPEQELLDADDLIEQSVDLETGEVIG